MIMVYTYKKKFQVFIKLRLIWSLTGGTFVLLAANELLRILDCISKFSSFNITYDRTDWYTVNFIQGITGPHRQNDRPCREDHFLWRNIQSQTCRLWLMRRWRCSPVRVGIEYKQLYTYFIEKGMFLQYVFKQSALCLIARLISSIGQHGRATGPCPIHCCCPQRKKSKGR